MTDFYFANFVTKDRIFTIRTASLEQLREKSAMVCKSKFTFNFNINEMDKDIRRQDKHTSSVIKKDKFVIKEKGKKNIKAYPNN